MCLHASKSRVSVLDPVTNTWVSTAAADVHVGDRLRAAAPHNTFGVDVQTEFTVVVTTARPPPDRWVVLDPASLGGGRPAAPLWLTPDQAVVHLRTGRAVTAESLARHRDDVAAVATPDDRAFTSNFFCRRPVGFPDVLATILCNGAPVCMRFASDNKFTAPNAPARPAGVPVR
jgi:hypothetical protein